MLKGFGLPAVLGAFVFSVYSALRTAPKALALISLSSAIYVKRRQSVCWKALLDYVREHHEPLKLTSLMLEESSPLFTEHFDAFVKESRTLSAQVLPADWLFAAICCLSDHASVSVRLLLDSSFWIEMLAFAWKHFQLQLAACVVYCREAVAGSAWS